MKWTNQFQTWSSGKAYLVASSKIRKTANFVVQYIKQRSVVMVYFYRLEYDYNYHPVPIGPVYESTWYFDSDWLIYNGLAWYDQV